MSSKKALIRGSLVVAGVLGASAPALALDYNVGGTGNLNGTSKVTGPTNASLGGFSIPCTSTFTLSDTAGSGAVTAATFSGASPCSLVTACSLPWTIGKPLAAIGVTNNVKISGVCVHLPSPINATCTGTVTGTLSSGGGFTFTGTLSGGCGVNSRSPGLTSSPVLGIQ